MHPGVGWRSRVITLSSDIERVIKTGHRILTPWYQLVYIKTDRESGRFAVIVRKRLGSAVRRNRMKRRFKEIIRRDGALQEAAIDIVVMPREESIKETWTGLREAVHASINAGIMETTR